MTAYVPRAARSDWRTPPEIVSAVREVFEGSISLDPCAPVDGGIADIHFTGPYGTCQDGLAGPWYGDVYVNPPFGELAAWAEKCASEAGAHARSVILLLPARTDTRYWHEYVSTSRAVCFLRGRLRFVGAPGPCPFPVALAYWGPKPWEFHRVFSERGMVVTL